MTVGEGLEAARHGDDDRASINPNEYIDCCGLNVL